VLTFCCGMVFLFDLVRTPVALFLLTLVACGTASSPAAHNGGPGPDAPTQFFSAAPPVQENPRLPAPAPLTLVAGDLLHITVFRHKDLELQVRVPEGGAFAYPLIGDVKAAGRTTKDVEGEIKARLEEKYLHKAGVTLTVAEYTQRKVYVLGGVRKPGGYDFHTGRRMTVLQLVSAAEGYTDRAFKEYCQLIRRKEGGERELIRLSLSEVERAVARGRVEADLELAPDDLLVIPSAARVVYVMGQVNKPGAFELPTDTKITVSMAISQAGSWTKYASIGRIQVLRQPPTGEPVRISVDMNLIVEGDLSKDVELHPGDVVWVPQRSIF